MEVTIQWKDYVAPSGDGWILDDDHDLARLVQKIGLNYRGFAPNGGGVLVIIEDSERPYLEKFLDKHNIKIS